MTLLRSQFWPDLLLNEQCMIYYYMHILCVWQCSANTLTTSFLLWYYSGNHTDDSHCTSSKECHTARNTLVMFLNLSQHNLGKPCQCIATVLPVYYLYGISNSKTILILMFLQSPLSINIFNTFTMVSPMFSPVHLHLQLLFICML